MRRLAVAIAVAIAALAVVCTPTLAADVDAEARSSYRVETTDSTNEAKVGEKGRVVVTIRPNEPKIHVNEKAPFKAKLEAPAGVQVEKADLGRKDIADAKAHAPRLEVPFTAAAAGRHEVKANLDFYICDEAKWCVRQTPVVTIPVVVK